MSLKCKKQQPLCECPSNKSSESGPCGKIRSRSNSRARSCCSGEKVCCPRPKGYVIKQVEEYIAPPRPAMRPICSESCEGPELDLDLENISPCGETAVDSANDKTM
ncbi:hypothetical protein EGW08_015486 [Elysia chlorotica]|uniref:Uncharacterized protein n=1 Tax=Elysia chlorotica TaxID=188477 RepID=A0A433T5B5_ELYCH|nr:hypothetical protein EGW08_015486 [Elysia chlorotica]